MVPIKILETIKKDGYEIRREEYSECGVLFRYK
jgi:hypothetical protein